MPPLFEQVGIHDAPRKERGGIREGALRDEQERRCDERLKRLAHVSVEAQPHVGRRRRGEQGVKLGGSSLREDNDRHVRVARGQRDDDGVQRCIRCVAARMCLGRHVAAAHVECHVACSVAAALGKFGLRRDLVLVA